MNMKTSFIISIIFLTCQSMIAQTPIKVEVKLDGTTWNLYRDGKPYYIKGAGGDKYMDRILECGGNSLRTWGSENAQQILDDAQKHGLTVMLGLWVQHERHGFDYNNKAKIEKQLNDFRETVKKYKDHPALLLWGVGNEVDLSYSNTNVWDAINDIAKMIHELDPNHPTSTVTAGLDSSEVAFIKQKTPNIDIYGINTYGDIGNVKENIRKFGWNGPYMITEWGPNGHWESPKTEWGSSIEQTSKEKFIVYKERYDKFIYSDVEKCVGSYVFLWGHKQEYTGTWYGMFTEKGEPTETVDAIEYCWKEKLPTNTAPSIDSLVVIGMNKNQNIYLKSENKFEAQVFSTNRENDKLIYRWFVLPESTDLKSGGDAELKPEELRGLIKSKKDNKIIFKAPINEGAYRLFVTVSDGKKVGYANITFYVIPRTPNDPPAHFVNFKHPTMNSFQEN
ncbi:MAG: hypothetical protein K9H41_05310 [Bacteroidia bacterium]|nr:hypothetical protein [Bacteroidia bacterium]